MDDKFVKEIEKTSIQKNRKVYVNGVGYENPDGTGIQTNYKRNLEAKLLKEEPDAEYPYLVEYQGTQRYFKDVIAK